jgi:hypothetical protein
LYIGASVKGRTIVVTTGDVAERKRPEARPPRLVIEYYGEGEAALVLRMRHAALERGEPVREWVLRAIRAQLEREERDDRPPG